MRQNVERNAESMMGCSIMLVIKYHIQWSITYIDVDKNGKILIEMLIEKIYFEL